MAKRTTRKRKKRSNKNKSNKLKLPIILIIIIVGLKCFLDNNFTLFQQEPIIYVGKINDIELPKITDSTYFIENTIGRYAYYYSPKDKQAKWVSYMLTKSDLTGKRVKRSNYFRVDNEVIKRKWETAYANDYYKSNYDRGHLLPSADRSSYKNENSETYLFSNISPQKSSLNRNTWKYLEEQIRVWAKKHDTLYVVTGGVLEDNKMGYIGKNKVTIPHRFYKVILSVKNNQYNAIGFVIPNSPTVSADFMRYAMDINQVEKIAKIDFFDNLPRKIERKVEKEFDSRFWTQTVELNNDKYR